jgi:hypothetical protein
MIDCKAVFKVTLSSDANLRKDGSVALKGFKSQSAFRRR